MKVIIYTTEACSRCKVLKKIFTESNIEYEERNLEDTKNKTDLYMRDLVILSAPAIEINGMVFEYKGE